MNHHKKQLNIYCFYQRSGKKTIKKYCKKMYEYSKWSPDNFTLDFGSIETISIHQNICKTTFCLVFWILQFLQNVTFSDSNIDHILTWNQASVQKYAKQNFGTYKDHIWALNSNSDTFFSTKYNFSGSFRISLYVCTPMYIVHK